MGRYVILFFLFFHLLAADSFSKNIAIPGEPFGVGKLEIPLEYYYEYNSLNFFLLKESTQRAFYPVYEFSQIHTGRGTQTKKYILTYYFLFQGEEELKLTHTYRAQSYYSSNTSGEISLLPQKESPEAYQNLLAIWWGLFQKTSEMAASEDWYNPMVENYLLKNLSSRLNLPSSQINTFRWIRDNDINEILGFFTGAESLRIAMQERVLLKSNEEVEKINTPFPAPLNLPSVPIPFYNQQGLVLESIAQYIPHDCFYIRFGSFENFQWFRKTFEEWGTQVRDFASNRGVDYRMNDRIKHQLALKDTFLSKLLGGTLISDVALFGTDTFFNEGSSIGILFEARDSTLLQHQLQKIRQEVMTEAGGSEQSITLLDHSVSFISTPENGVRSFYVVEGKYHLVTNSQSLARLFLEVAKTKASLATLEEFRYARSLMPVSRNDRVFIYLSDPFFRRILGPQYRVEMTRRIQAASEIDVVRLASLTARSEKKPYASIEDLIGNGYLPENFGRRSDQSSVTLLSDGSAVDSLRGAYGSFIPIPDVELKGMTSSEYQAYETFMQNYRRAWERGLDPVIVAIQQQQTEIGEKVTFDVHITPYARSVYGWISQWITPRNKNRMPLFDGTIAQLQVNAQGSFLFAGLGDFSPQYVIKNGELLENRLFDNHETPYYLGTDLSTERNISSWVFGNINEIKYHEYTQKGQDWCYRWPPYMMMSSQKEFLEKIVPQVKSQPGEREAQIRLQVGDLLNRKLSHLINDAGFLYLSRISENNVAFLYTLNQQLHLPITECISTAETLVNAKLISPLSTSEYNLAGEGDAAYFSTTGNDYSSSYGGAAPADYTLPFIQWFAGL
ncbi:MAG: hypothetical protein AABZ60_01635, partial [Planctomycetota bacterium]